MLPSVIVCSASCPCECSAGVGSAGVCSVVCVVLVNLVLLNVVLVDVVLCVWCHMVLCC